MTAETNLAGASFHTAVEWHTIDWSKVHHNVRRLQTRIVKAVQAGRWGKVKALQRLLTHSFSGKALAVKRVTGKQRQTDTGRGWRNLEHANSQNSSPWDTTPPRIPSSTATAHLYPQKRRPREAPPFNPRYER
jgi:hypothetical protein